MYFRSGPGSRIFKKKSHHYIVPPASEKDPNWIPIEIEEYKKRIFIKDRDSSMTIDDVHFAVNLEFPSVKYTVSEKESWFIILVEGSRFLEFHRLVQFCSLSNKGDVWGYCTHPDSNIKDYIVKDDVTSTRPHLIGAFRSDLNFGIYLPTSEVHKKGNMSKSFHKEVDFENESAQFPI